MDETVNKAKTSHQVEVQLNITQDEFLRWYSGVAQQVSCHALDGRTVRFPANLLQPFITHEGVYGLFKISFDEKGKFLDIERLTSVTTAPTAPPGEK